MSKTIFSPEHKKALSDSLKGLQKSEEHKKAISAAMRLAYARKKKSIGVDAFTGTGTGGASNSGASNSTDPQK